MSLINTVYMMRLREDSAESCQKLLKLIPHMRCVNFSVFSLWLHEIHYEEGVEGYIVTSKNGLRALALSRYNKQCLLYVVGEASRQYATGLGFSNVQLGLGNGYTLADKILQEAPSGKYLYIHGDWIRFHMGEYLKRACVNLKVLSCQGYSIRTDYEVLNELRSLDASPEHVVFLSYSQRQSQLMSEFLPSKFQTSHIIGLSKDVLLPFQEQGYHNLELTPKPTELAMFQSLQQITSLKL